MRLAAVHKRLGGQEIEEIWMDGVVGTAVRPRGKVEDKLESDGSRPEGGTVDMVYNRG